MSEQAPPADAQSPPSVPHPWRILFWVLSVLSPAVLTLRATVVPREAIGRMGGAVLLASAVFVAGRLRVRLGVPYYNWRGRKNEIWTDADRAALNQLVMLDADLAVALMVAGVWFFAEPNLPVAFAVSLVLGIFAAIIAFRTRDLVRPQRPGGPPRGSDVVEDCPPVVKIRERSGQVEGSAGFLMRWYMRVFAKTPSEQLSWLTVLIVLGIFSVSISQASAGIPDAVAWVTRHTNQVEHGSSQFRDAVDTVREKLEQEAAEAAAQDAVKVAPESPSDEPDCDNSVTPGDGIPKPYERQRQQLRAAWEALGPKSTGCPSRAERVPRTHVYYVVGTGSSGELQSIGVVSPAYLAAVLQSIPAELAHDLAQSGRLRGASARNYIGEGDYHVVFTDAGPWVVIRSNNGGSQPYVQLPPPLARLWLRLGALGKRTWPVLTDSDGDERSFDFKTDPLAGPTVATGRCVGDDRCKLRYRDISWDEHDLDQSPRVTVDSVLRFGPG